MAPAAKESGNKRERLTLSQLASYDDILTDALVDHVFFWTTIRKNRAKYNLTRGINEDEITAVLRKSLIDKRDAVEAEQNMLRLSGLRKFLERLRTKREKEDFQRHLRKYINVWSNDCPFEISTTNRYTIVTHEAAVYARHDIKKGDVIKYLCGTLVPMTPEEELDLDLTRRDFSIVMSSRRKTPSLFLGPARFANHDCGANAKLTTTGSDGMTVVALRDIDLNEEITVTYGADYFGIGNCECLCRTCEIAQRNGWAATANGDKGEAMVQSREDEADGPYRFRRKRKFGQLGTQIHVGVHIHKMTPESEDRGSVKRSRSEMSNSSATAPPSTAASSVEQLPEVKARPVEVAQTFTPPVEDERVPSTQAAVGQQQHQEQKSLEIRTQEDLKSKARSQEAQSLEIRTQNDLKSEVPESSNPSQRESIHLPEIALSPPPRPHKQDEPQLLPLTPSKTHLANFQMAQLMTRTEGSQSSMPLSESESVFDEVDLIRAASTPASTPRCERSSHMREKDGIVMDDDRDEGVTLFAAKGTTVTNHDLKDSVPLPAAVGECDSLPTVVDISLARTEGASQLTLPNTIKSPPLGPTISALQDSSDSELSELSPNEDFDDENLAIKRKKRGRGRPPGTGRRQRNSAVAAVVAAAAALLTPASTSASASQERPSSNNSYVGPISQLSLFDSDGMPTRRYPGDYTRTPLLLSEPYSRWVDCQTCPATWVQPNGYTTKRECPRCERHSKLYGYQWPKTERFKGDPERVKDHRTVHRFLDADEERALRKAGRGVAGIGSGAGGGGYRKRWVRMFGEEETTTGPDSSSDAVDVPVVVPIKRGRGRPRTVRQTI